VGNSAITLGQKTMAASIPVVLASDESTVLVNQPTASNLNVTIRESQPASQNATWTSATAQGTNLTINCTGYDTVVVQIDTNSGTFSAGKLAFYTAPGGNTIITGMRYGGITVLDNAQKYDAQQTHDLVASQQWTYRFNVSGLTQLFVNLSTAITGTGSVTLTAILATGSAPGPTTVGQSDASKLNATTLAATNAVVSATITSATPTGLILAIPCLGYTTVTVNIKSAASGTHTGGTIQFEGVGPGNFNSSITGIRQLDANATQFYDATSQQSLNLPNDARYIFQLNVAGLQTVNVVLSPAFTGTGSIIVSGIAINAPAPGPTTVGQSDASKLNATAVGATGAIASTTWTSATSLFTTLNIPCLGYSSVTVFIYVNGTVTGGGLVFLGSAVTGVANTMRLVGMREGQSTEQLYDASSVHTFASNTQFNYTFACGGLDAIQIELTPAITGAGSVQILARATAAPTPGPTTVGQSDPTKLNALVAKAAASIAVTNPAAGADWTATVTQAGVLQSLRARLVTNATVANRVPLFIINDDSARTVYASAPFTQTAGLTVDYIWGLALPINNTNGVSLVPIPQIVVMPNWIIKVVTTAIQAGDQWNPITYSLQTS
jgi:hypothetical protein